MSAWLNRFRRDQKGVAVVEFGLFLPLLMLLLVGMAETGRVLYHTNAVEKGLRSGALYAARSEFPLSGDAKTAVENIVKTGNAAGSPPYLVSGWAKAGADFDITTTDVFVDGEPLPVVHLDAVVPYDPLLPGMLSFLGLGDFKIRVSHEQAFLGL